MKRVEEQRTQLVGAEMRGYQRVVRVEHDGSDSTMKLTAGTVEECEADLAKGYYHCRVLKEEVEAFALAILELFGYEVTS